MADVLKFSFGLIASAKTGRSWILWRGLAGPDQPLWPSMLPLSFPTRLEQDHAIASYPEFIAGPMLRPIQLIGDAWAPLSGVKPWFWS
jgi:hypothetical protein